MIELHANAGRINIRLRAIFMGKDLCILIDGGDSPHIGAISLANSQIDNQLQTLLIPHHKENIISQAVAKSVKQALGNTICCICGIHVNNISKEEIKKVLEMTNDLSLALLEQLK